MPFSRRWDVTCPKVWDRWEAGGVQWVVQDLPPESDEEALQLLMEHLVPDEVMCITSELLKDPVSMASISEFWRTCLAQRLSLACYAEAGGMRTLAALNCCVVTCEGEKEANFKVEGEGSINVFKALKYVGEKTDVYKYLGEEQLLYGMGLVVRRGYRGAKLGSKVLAAREPLCLSQGLKATSTVFSGVASQRSAARAGFITVAEVTMRELADAGLNYPRDDRILKCMVKKY